MSMVEYDTQTEAQAAFLTLLTRPLLTAHTDRAGLRQVLMHRARLGEWAARLGYRLVAAGGVVRLHRDPAGPQRTAAPPAWNPPARRVLVLQALAAAACESAGGASTVQGISDEARALSVSPGARVTPYDPDRRAERHAFLKALDRLVEVGVLVRRTSDETLLRQWEQDGTGVGAGFDVDPDALLQLTDPYTVELALAARPDPDAETGRTATRGQRMLRILVEDTALIYSDLHPADAEYARGQRSWLAAQAAEMTGGTVELRAEGMLLRLPADGPVAAAVAPFPAATASSWFALKALETAFKAGPAPDQRGSVRLPADTVDNLADHLYATYAGALTEALSASAGQLRSAVEGVLGGLGLLRVGQDRSWTIAPVAARYRDPRATWEPTLTDPELL